MGGGRGAVTELVAEIFGVSTGTETRAIQDFGGEKGQDSRCAKIRDPLPPGPYALAQAGYNFKYEEERRKMVQSYGDMRASGETVNVPAMALSLTEEGGAAAYAPMEMGDPPDEEVEKTTRWVDRKPTRKTR